jgi:hypothetical protein
MSDFDFEIYGGKTFKDLCKDVIDRSSSKKDQIDTIIGDLRTLIKGPNDVQMFIPRIKELLEVGVKNDEQLIKLAAVVQRIQSTQIEVSGGEGSGLTEEEKNKLMEQHMADVQKNLIAIKKETETSIPQ